MSNDTQDPEEFEEEFETELEEDELEEGEEDSDEEEAEEFSLEDTLIYSHLVDHLGEPSAAFPPGELNDEQRIPLAVFDDQPGEGATTWTTLGLAEIDPEVDGEDGPLPPLGIELMLNTYEYEGEEDITGEIAWMLNFLGERMLVQEDSVQLFDLMEFDNPVFPGTDKTSFFLTPLLYFDNDLDTYESDLGEVRILQLVPLTAEEAEKLNEVGPETFYRMIQDQEPDLLDVDRPPLDLDRAPPPEESEESAGDED